MRRSAFILLSLFMAQSAFAITIGPSQTKKEREKTPLAGRAERAGSYEAVMESFLSADFARSERLAESFRAPAGDGRSDEINMIRALSLMKLGRHRDARPILERLQGSASSGEIRAQASYSLADSYYFGNDRVNADLYYKKALDAYPEHGEAQNARRLLGLDHPPALLSGTAGPLRQMGIEEGPLYSVQVGAFSKRRNAERLLNKLVRKRYDAYIDQQISRHYRVRVGHLTVREDAQNLETRLKKDGYPTKIFP